jgi:hypothetical protein
MENRQLIIFAGFLAATASPTLAANFLPAKDITYVFVGREVSGIYSNSVTFSEVYHLDGRIDYAEGQMRTAGRWRIEGTSFCTDYYGVPGGCFKITAHSKNCFEYWLVDAKSGTVQSTWMARSWQSKYPSTCPHP